MKRREWVRLGQGALFGAGAMWLAQRFVGACFEVTSLHEHTPGLNESHGNWDIAPGETLREDGSRDVVLEGSMGSFPASDPPGYSP